MYHPWRVFREKAQWLLRFGDLPGQRRGHTDFESCTVIIDKRLLQVERRCTICHELVHTGHGRLSEYPILETPKESLVA